MIDLELIREVPQASELDFDLVNLKGTARLVVSMADYLDASLLEGCLVIGWAAL